MASRSLGTLTLDLVARIGGFTGPMDKAGRETQKQMAEIRKHAERLGTAVGASFAAIPAVVTGLVTSSAAAAKEISNLSALAGLSTTEFQRYAAAAASVGVQQDKLSDIFKDTNDKVGDFLATGGGELKNFFETIAPKVGVTAEQFRKLSSADALQLYVNSLQKANVNQAQMTFFMEAIADEATALVPLLADGGKKFRELGDSAEAAGMVLDGTTIAAALEFNNQLTTIGQYASSAKTALAAEFMPVLAQLAKDLADTTKEAGGLQKRIRDFSDDFIEVGAMAASTGDGIGRAFKTVAISMAGTFATTMAYIQSIGATANLVLSKVTFGDLSADFKKNSDQMSADAKDSARAANTIFLELGETMNKAWAGDSIREYVKQARKAAADLPKLDLPGAGKPGVLGQTDAQKAAAKAAEAAQKKIKQAFETTEESYQRQIALINTEVDKRKDATEVAKLQFELESGKLHGLSAQQQDRLKGLAAELDQLKQLKLANEENAKAASYASTLAAANATAKSGFDMEFVGAGMGSKTRERLQGILEVRQEFDQKFADLQEQRNSGDISESLFKREAELLQSSLDERLSMLVDYYGKQDEMQSDWLSGVKDAWQNFADEAQNYSAMAADATASVLGSAKGELSSFMSDVATGSKDAGDALMDMVTGFAKAGVQALSDMAAQWLVYQAVQLLVGKTTQSTAGMGMVANAQSMSFQAQLNAYAATAAIPLVGPAMAPAAAAAAAMATAPMVAGVASTALMGMAHDGIDSIPREGTWLLDGGERVLNPNQNRDLTQYLRNANDAGGGGSALPPISVQVNVEVPPGTSGSDSQRIGDAAAAAIEQKMEEVLYRATQQGGILWRQR